MRCDCNAGRYCNGQIDMSDFDPIPVAERNYCDAQDMADDAHESAYETAHGEFLHVCSKRDASALLGGVPLDEVIRGLCDLDGADSTDFIGYFLDAACGYYSTFSAEKKLKKLAEQYALGKAGEVTV